MLVALHPECALGLNKLPVAEALAKADVSPNKPVHVLGKFAPLAKKLKNDEVAIAMYVWGLEIELLAEDVAWLALRLESKVFKDFCNELVQRPWRVTFLWERVMEVLGRLSKGGTKVELAVTDVGKCARRF